VAVDLRRGSPSFDQWVGAVLSAANHQQLWVPAGFAYGFLTLTEQAEVLYKTQPRHDFEQGLSATVNWYLDHALWCQKACRFSGHGVVQASVPSSLS